VSGWKGHWPTVIVVTVGELVDVWIAAHRKRELSRRESADLDVQVAQDTERVCIFLAENGYAA
jgi:hypothetical protein